jgi:tetratricopeptide (TPR) repeat protein
MTRRLPLLAALGAFVVYAFSLSHGVTVNSLPLTAKVAGWDWTPMAGQPLLWLLTLPLRLLPAGWAPLGLNLFSAIAAAVTVGMLARTVQLLPWEHSWEDVSRRARALPVLLACAVCGLEFSFWQEATVATGEMLDLLLLVASLWLLLEYRVRRESWWLDAAVFVWGLGMAENWLMLLALPIFVGGIIWLHGILFFLQTRPMHRTRGGVIWLRWIRLFKVGFMLRLAGLGLLGFSIYALLPLVNGLAPHSDWSLGQAWIASLKQTKSVFQALYYQIWLTHQVLALVVAAYFLVPALVCLMRFRDERTSETLGMNPLEIWFCRGLRVLLLLVCLWLAFDPVPGPRQVVQHQIGVSLPMLALDYLDALGAGFLAGNLLLISHRMVHWHSHSQTRERTWRRTVNFASTWLVLIFGSLAVRNAPAIFHMNYHSLQHFGELAADSLPAGRGMMLSDQAQKLAVFQAAISERRNGADWVAVDTHALPTVGYRAWLERHHPAGWLTEDNQHELTPVETVRLLEQMSRANRLFYLHPSYGYYFERFYLEPAGAIYEMKLRSENSPDNPPLSGSATDANEVFWNRAWQKDLSRFVSASMPRQTVLQKAIQSFGITRAPFFQDRLLGEWHSLSLDAWGVALQQQGRLNEARTRLEQALQLNTNNFSARISLASNTSLQTGLKSGLAGLKKVAGQLGDFQRLSLIMNNCGPIDEPVFCYLLGCTYEKTGLPLQAAQQFERTRTLAPGMLAPEYALAEIYSRLHLTDRARPFINHLHYDAKNLSANGAVDFDLALLEANYWLAQTNAANARSALQSVLLRHPDDAQIAHRVLKAYLAFGDYTNALQILNNHLSKSPDDITDLNNKAAILFASGKPAETIPVLDRVLALTNLPEARFNRASARLASHDYAGAEGDYHELEKSGIELDRASYGLAIIAEYRHDTNLAIHYLRLCLENTPTGTPFWRDASARLQALETGARGRK